MTREPCIESLEKVMRREIAILRELLGSLRQEQDAVLHNAPASVKELQQQREEIIEAMATARGQRMDLLEGTSWEHGESWTHEELAVLRQQMVNLLDAVKRQTERNNHLLNGKVQLNKQMMQQLQPKDPNTTYGPQAKKKPAVKTATLTLINREV